MNFLEQIRGLGNARPAGVVSPVPKTNGGRIKPSAGYMKGGGNNVLFHNHRPALREPKDDVRMAWPQATARATYAIQNSGYLAGGIDQAVALTVGTGLKLSAKPDYESLGWTKQKSREWAKSTERQFRLWSQNPIECDATGKKTLGMMSVSALRQWFGYGEIVALLPTIQRTNTSFSTRVMMIPPTRLKQESQPYQNIHQGIRVDAVGMPIGYQLKFTAHNGDLIDREFQSYSPTGRRQVVHVFDGAPSQMRGLTPLAAALLRARQFDQLSDATLTTTLLQTIFAASIKSGDLPEDAFDSLAINDEEADVVTKRAEAMGDWYENAGLDLGVHGRVTHLMPGDELNFHSAEHPHDNYEAFASGLLREMARAIGCTYEQLTGNYTSATYSSVRMATSEMWQIALQRRDNIAAPFMQSAYEAWLEEAILIGRVQFTGGITAFYRNKTAACRASWMGPSRPSADDLKTAKARSIEIGNGLKTMQQSVSEEGVDYDDHMEQLAAEMEQFDELGLVHPLKKGVDVDPSEGLGADMEQA